MKTHDTVCMPPISGRSRDRSGIGKNVGQRHQRRIEIGVGEQQDRQAGCLAQQHQEQESGRDLRNKRAAGEEGVEARHERAGVRGNGQQRYGDDDIEPDDRESYPKGHPRRDRRGSRLRCLCHRTVDFGGGAGALSTDFHGGWRRLGRGLEHIPRGRNVPR
ncbi:MAG: hypothetical protein ACHQPH_00200 [Reyranellales bacterium]